MDTKKYDEQFINILNEIKNHGVIDENPRPKYKDGSSAHCKYISQRIIQTDYSKGELPCTSLRNVAVKMGIKEIMWIYQMQSNKLEDAHSVGVKWWDDWSVGDGTIGQRYGATVKKYDLMNGLLNNLINDTFSRRHLLSLWQVEDFKTKGLNPCAFLSMYTVRKVNDIYYLDTTLNQRSSDFIMCASINSMQYLALALMICSHMRYHTGQKWQVGVFTHFIQNVHIYDRHEQALEELMSREPIEDNTQVFALNVDKNFYDITLEDFEIKLPNHGKLQTPLELAI